MSSMADNIINNTFKIEKKLEVNYSKLNGYYFLKSLLHVHEIPTPRPSSTKQQFQTEQLPPESKVSFDASVSPSFSVSDSVICISCS